MRTRIKNIVFFAIAWSSLAMFLLLIFLSNLLQKPNLYIIAFYLFILAGAMILISFEYMSGNSVGQAKFAIFIVLSTLCVVFSMDEDALIQYNSPDGLLINYPSGLYSLFTSLLILYIALVYFSQNLRIFLHSPRRMKKYAAYNLTGAMFLAILVPISVLFQLYLVIPNIDTLAFSIGLFMIAHQYAHHIELLFIVPFRIGRLDVIHMESGIGLYSHIFEISDAFDEMLFSGMIQGIQLILNEAVNKGTVKAINMENGHVLIHQNPKSQLFYVLVTTKTSKLLSESLLEFASLFEKEFHQEISKSAEISQFLGAERFIQNVFYYIPKFD